MDIKINIGSNETPNWVEAYDYQKRAFNNFKSEFHELDEFVNKDGGFIFTIKRSGKNGGIYLHRENGTFSPICDWNDVMVFKRNDNEDLRWHKTNSKETKAYFDFIYSDTDSQTYEKYFTLLRNTNGTINIKYKDFETRISDNYGYRNYYRGFINRMTTSPYDGI